MNGVVFDLKAVYKAVHRTVHKAEYGIVFIGMEISPKFVRFVLWNARNVLMHHFYIWIFKNASPLGFMIEIYSKKPVLRGDKKGIRYSKNEVQSEKNEVRLWFALFYDFLSKVLEMIFLSEWEGFGSFFEMIFSSENARSFKKFRLNLYTTFIRFVVPENLPS